VADPGIGLSIELAEDRGVIEIDAFTHQAIVFEKEEERSWNLHRFA